MKQSAWKKCIRYKEIAAVAKAVSKFAKTSIHP
jgi:hypothetical protein